MCYCSNFDLNYCQLTTVPSGRTVMAVLRPALHEASTIRRAMRSPLMARWLLASDPMVAGKPLASRIITDTCKQKGYWSLYYRDYLDTDHYTIEILDTDHYTIEIYLRGCKSPAWRGPCRPPTTSRKDPKEGRHNQFWGRSDLPGLPRRPRWKRRWRQQTICKKMSQLANEMVQRAIEMVS
jgi:hypothetical protein